MTAGGVMRTVDHMTTTYQAEITEALAAAPDDVFALLTDIERLPEWNAHIHHVIDAPPSLVHGAQWVVQMRAMGTRWGSRSTAQTIDPETRVFTHKTQTDDGNPSYALWTWRVAEHGGGSEVTVRWELNPKTSFRRHFGAPLRHRQLQNEVRISLDAADRLLADDTARA
jgi:uncharacterized protein YndB with AHSA1/START domain